MNIQYCLSRRQFLSASSALLVSVGLPACAEVSSEGSAFSFDTVIMQAKKLANKPFIEPVIEQPDVLQRINYDAYQQIKFNSDKSLFAQNNFPVQLFLMGQLFTQPVRIFVVQGNTAHAVLFDKTMFTIPAEHAAHQLKNVGFAGFRVMNDAQSNRDWLSFLGASYFRTSGLDDQYGLSARGLAINTGQPTPEEFPRFTHFWLSPSPQGIVVHALLDSFSVAGAYRFFFNRQEQMTTDVEAHLFPRRTLNTVGLAPLSSMYWYSERDRKTGVDWRPEIHDSDGLFLYTGKGERIYRPLHNPYRTITSTFADHNPRGFGLVQRDRNFENYQDDGVFYEKRPSVYIEPLHAWGDGAVHLLEIPTNDEIHDNIALYWRPAKPLLAGRVYIYKYRLSWHRTDPLVKGLGHVISTRIGRGGTPGAPRPEGSYKIAIDFEFNAPAPNKENMQSVVSMPPHIQMTQNYVLPIVEHNTRARLIFDITGIHSPEPQEIRVFLRGNNGEALTETCLIPFVPV